MVDFWDNGINFPALYIMGLELIQRPDEEADPFGFLLRNRTLTVDERQYSWYFWQHFGAHLLAGFYQLNETIEQCGISTDVWWRNENNVNVLASRWQRLQHVTSAYRQSDFPLTYADVTINIQARTKEIALHDNRFKAELYLTRTGWSDDNADQALNVWLYRVMDPDAWIQSEQKIEVPFILELPMNYDWFPRSVNFGGIPFELRFDRLLIPMTLVKRMPYIGKLFDYIGQTYENVADMRYKGRVFELLTFFMNMYRVDGPWLDVGSGTGLFRDYAPDGVELWGLDVSGYMSGRTGVAKKANGQRAYTKVFQAEAANTNLADSSVGAAFMSFVEIWMTDTGWARSMAEMYRVVKSGAPVAVNFHKPPRFWKESSARVMYGLGFSQVEFYEDRAIGDDGKTKQVCIMVARK